MTIQHPNDEAMVKLISVGPIKSIKQLNRTNQKFWAKRSKRQMRLMNKRTHITRDALRRYALDMKPVERAGNEQERHSRMGSVLRFDEYLELANKKRKALAQESNGQRRRSPIGQTNISVHDIITDIASDPQQQGFIAKVLWSAFVDRLRQHGCDLQESGNTITYLSRDKQVSFSMATFQKKLSILRQKRE